LSDASIVEQFDAFAEHARRVLEKVADAGDVDPLLAEARECFARLVPEMPYADRRDHVVWDPMLSAYQWLAVHLACRERGIDAHGLGRALLQVGAPEGSVPGAESADEYAARALRDAAASQEGAAENEYVFEIVPGDGEKTDYGVNITRCGICHAYAKHDAMEFTPYMCATDDLESDRLGQGLRRTGTIALGAHRCDFRYKAGGEPLRLAEQYPDQIRSGRRVSR
jgi:hypothetical protein